MPMAVISTARLAACRSGRYASPSIVMPKTVHTTIAAKIATMGGRPQYCSPQKAIYAPTMIMSPWAKFSILAMPYTIVYPSAMMA